MSSLLESGRAPRAGDRAALVEDVLDHPLGDQVLFTEPERQALRHLSESVRP
jgi:hypothetical protein